MTLFLASDHRGFKLKQVLAASLLDFKPSSSTNSNDNPNPNPPDLKLVDCGPATFDPTDDYVDYGSKALSQLQSSDKAVLICGSGHGMDILANRHPNVRGVLGFNDSVVKQGRTDEDANVLILPADWISETQAVAFTKIFLTTPFSQADRHIRRLEKLNQLATSLLVSPVAEQ